MRIKGILELSNLINIDNIDFLTPNLVFLHYCSASLKCIQLSSFNILQHHLLQDSLPTLLLDTNTVLFYSSHRFHSIQMKFQILLSFILKLLAYFYKYNIVLSCNL